MTLNGPQTEAFMARKAAHDAGGATLYERALDIAAFAHGAQVDKSGAPYLTHLVSVARLARGIAEEYDYNLSEEEEAAALLHDSVEDTDLTVGDLLALGVPPRTASLVQVLTRVPSRETHRAYVQRIADTDDVGLMVVKCADAAHNGRLWRALLLPESERGLQRRYEETEDSLHYEIQRALGDAHS